MTALRHEREKRASPFSTTCLPSGEKNLRVEIQHYICSVCRQLLIQNSEKAKPNNNKPSVVLLRIIYFTGQQHLMEGVWWRGGGAISIFKRYLQIFLGISWLLSHSAILLSASLLQAPLFYSLTSYFQLKMECLIVFVLPRVSWITQISLLLQKMRIFIIVFSCISCRHIFHITSFVIYFWWKKVSLRVSNRTQPTNHHSCQGQGDKWHLREIQAEQDSLLRQPCCLTGALPDKSRLKESLLRYF